MAVSGMTAEEIVAAHDAICLKWGKVVLAMVHVQKYVLDNAQRSSAEEYQAEKDMDVNSLPSSYELARARAEQEKG